MPHLRCDTHIDKPSIDIADRVSDLRNRVKWLKNVEYCLLDDQNDRLTKMKAERHDIEITNNDLRKKFKTPTEKMIVNQFDKNINTVEDIECINYKRNQVMQEHNQLVYIQRCLLNRLKSLNDQKENKLRSVSIKSNQDDKIFAHRIREVQDRLKNVKLINKTMNTCKEHLQCDLDLLRKELPNIQKDIEQKFHEKIILKKQLTDIVKENKQHLKAYQELLDHTETQNRQRHIIHEQAMTSVAEQLEDQYQVQMMVVLETFFVQAFTGRYLIVAINEMTTPFESRKLNGGGTNSTTNLTMMNNDEIIQIRCMYDQFYNLIMAGFPIDINQSEAIDNEVSAKTTAMLTMTNRMLEEKEQLNQQINRTDKLFKLIDMSMNLKNETRRKMLNTMVEQRQNLELFYMNDTVEEQNRIIRQINDFMIVLSKILCKYIDAQSIIEPATDFIQRLQYVSDLVSKTIKNMNTEPIDEYDRQTSPSFRRSGGEESSQILKESSSFDRSISSSLSSLSSRIKRNSMKTNIY